MATGVWGIHFLCCYFICWDRISRSSGWPHTYYIANFWSPATTSLSREYSDSPSGLALHCSFQQADTSGGLWGQQESTGPDSLAVSLQVPKFWPNTSWTKTIRKRWKAGFLCLQFFLSAKSPQAVSLWPKVIACLWRYLSLHESQLSGYGKCSLSWSLRTITK